MDNNWNWYESLSLSRRLRRQTSTGRANLKSLELQSERVELTLGYVLELKSVWYQYSSRCAQDRIIQQPEQPFAKEVRQLVEIMKILIRLLDENGDYTGCNVECET